MFQAWASVATQVGPAVDFLEAEFAATLVAHELQQFGVRSKVGEGQFLVGFRRKTVFAKQIQQFDSLVFVSIRTFLHVGFGSV